MQNLSPEKLPSKSGPTIRSRPMPNGLHERRSKFSATLELAKKIARNLGLFNSALSLKSSRSLQTDAIRATVKLEMAKAGMEDDARSIGIDDPEIDKKSSLDMESQSRRLRNAGSLDYQYVKRKVEKVGSEEFQSRVHEWAMGIGRLHRTDPEMVRLEDIRLHEFIRINNPEDVSSWAKPPHGKRPYDAAMRQISKAAGAAELGFTELARLCFDGIAEITESIENPWERLYVKGMLGVELARGGMEKEAVYLFEDILQSGMLMEELHIDERLPLFEQMLNGTKSEAADESDEEHFKRTRTLDLIGGVASGYALLGKHGRAKELFERAFWTIDFRAPLLKRLSMFQCHAQHQIEAGYYDSALMAFVNDSRLVGNVNVLAGMAMAKAADKSARPANLDKKELMLAVPTADKETTQAIGKVLTLPEIYDACSKIDCPDQRARKFRTMVLSRVSLHSLYDIRAEARAASVPEGVLGEACQLMKACRAKIYSVGSGSKMDESYFFALEIFKIFDNAGARACHLTIMSHVEALMEDGRVLPEHAMLLCQLEHPKATAMVFRMIGDGVFDEQEALGIIRAIPGGSVLMLDSMRIPEARREQRKRLILESIRLLVNELNISPTITAIDLVIRGASDIGGVEDNLRRLMESSGEEINGRQAFIEALSNDDNLAFAHYVANCGRTEYGLGNPYDFDKFTYILSKIRRTKNHEGVMDDFMALLPDDVPDGVVQSLLGGRFPLGASPLRRVTQKADAKVQDKMQKEMLGRIFGRDELGVVLKYAYYVFRKEKLDQDERILLSMCSNMAQAAVSIVRIDKNHPEMEDDLRQYGRRLNTLSGKGLLPASIGQMISEPELQVSKKTIQKIDERAILFREDIKEGRYKRIVKAIERDADVAPMLSGSSTHMLRIMIQGLMVPEMTPAVDALFTEWESHLERAFEMSKLEIRESEELMLRCLDKNSECVEAIRATDSTINCLNSTKWEKRYVDEELQKNYAFPFTGAEVIALANADPLTLIIQIEKPSKGMKKKAVGFVYLHMGEIDGELAVMLDTVYLQQGNQASIRSILDTIEEWISRPLGASWQVASTRFETYRPGPGYSNNPKKMMMLKAVDDEGHPIRKSRDDINIGANTPGVTDSRVWHKRLK